MNEKIIYEMGLVGASSCISQIANVSAAISSIDTSGLDRLNKRLGSAISGMIGLAGVARQLATLQSPFTRRGTNAAIDQGLVPNIDLRSANLEHFATNISDLREKRKRIAEFNKSTIRGLFGNISPLRNMLGWNGYSNVTDKSDVFWFGGAEKAVSDTYERHQKAEYLREGLRKKWKRNNPWSDLDPFPIVPVGERSVKPVRQSTALATLNSKYGIVDTGRVTDPGYIDAESRYVHEDRFQSRNPYEPSFGEWVRWSVRNSHTPYGFFRNMSHGSGAAGVVGKLGVWGLVFNVVMSSLAWFAKNIKRAVQSVKVFGDVLLQANESWKQMRESHAYGTSGGSLAGQWRRRTRIGGDAASASALWDRLSTDRAMLGFGGNGGSMMEAARLFGLNILGSGEYGYATNDELMRNVARLMPSLSKSGQLAMRKTLGLDAYDFWSVSNGEEYYNYLTGRKTILGQIRGAMLGEDAGRELFSEDSQIASRQFEGAWGDFVDSVKELGGVLGEAILPLLTILLDTLSGIAQAITTILKPTSWILNKFENLLNARWWSDMIAIGETPTSNQVQARMITVGADGRANPTTVNLSMGDISLNSLGLDDNASRDEIAQRVAETMWDKLGDHLISDRR